MKRNVFGAVIFLLAILTTVTSCQCEEKYTLIYHGQIEQLVIYHEGGIYSPAAFAIVPDGLVSIYSSQIDYYNGDNITTLTTWDKWNGDITYLSNIDAGEYYIYENKSGTYIISNEELGIRL